MGNDEQQRIGRFNVPEAGELLDGRYRVHSVIASGGMGVILRAEQVTMQRPVAIKLLHPHIAASQPTVVERFAREVRLAKQLNHPNTIRLYDFGESEEGLVYVAMELLEGTDLKRVITQEGPLAAGRALDITRQMLDGLAEAHSHDFIHRDLKPSNVFIAKGRRGGDLVKVLDFGIAKSLGDAVDLTGSGAICGTPSYVAPEYLMQEPPGKPADVYAVGLILLEMLTGRQVFRGQAPVQTMMMHLKLHPEIPPEIERTPLARVIRKATAKVPEARYQDAEQMFDAVCRIYAQVPSDLVVRAPNYRALPHLSNAMQLVDDEDEDAQRRARSDTIVPLDKPVAVGETGHDSGLDLPQAPGTPSRVQCAVGSDVFRRDLCQELQAEVCADESGSAGGSSRARRLAPVAALGVVAALGLLALVATDPGAPPQLDAPGASAAPAPSRPAVARPVASTPSDTAAPPAQPPTYRFMLDTDPGGADIEIDGRRIGQTPLDWRVSPDKLPQKVRLVLEGYEPREVELTRTSSPVVVELLQERRREHHHKPRARRSSRHRTPRKPSKAHKRTGAKVISNQRIEQVMDQYLDE